jgi:hypothetical protein
VRRGTSWLRRTATSSSRFAAAADPGGGIVALRDADGDGKLETKEQFGQGSATGIGLRNGYIYYATPTSIVRLQAGPRGS